MLNFWTKKYGTRPLPITWDLTDQGVQTYGTFTEKSPRSKFGTFDQRLIVHAFLCPNTVFDDYKNKLV